MHAYALLSALRSRSEGWRNFHKTKKRSAENEQITRSQKGAFGVERRWREALTVTRKRVIVPISCETTVGVL